MHANIHNYGKENCNLYPENIPTYTFPAVSTLGFVGLNEFLKKGVDSITLFQNSSEKGKI